MDLQDDLSDLALSQAVDSYEHSISQMITNYGITSEDLPNFNLDFDLEPNVEDREMERFGKLLSGKEINNLIDETASV